jgi:predicted amidohydrolase
LGKQTKTHLTELEGPAGLDLTAVPEKSLWETPLGKLGMIICADAWDAGIAAELTRQGAQVLLNCLANPEPWSDAQQVGMDGGSLPARVAETGLPGAQCYGVGRLFELSFNGKSQLLRPLPGGKWEAIARAKSANMEEVVAGVVELASP